MFRAPFDRNSIHNCVRRLCAATGLTRLDKKRAYLLLFGSRYARFLYLNTVQFLRVSEANASYFSIGEMLHALG